MAGLTRSGICTSRTNAGYPHHLPNCLFFDFDGLILDTETPEVISWQWLFKTYELEYPDEVWKNIVGRGPDQVIEQPEDLLKRLSGTSESPQELRVKFRNYYWDILELAPRPGSVELMESAASKGIRQCVVSSSDHTWVGDFLEKLGLTHFFETRVCRGDAPRTKPAPDLYLQALEVMQVEPSDVWVFEDSQNGVQAAFDAGLYVIACPNPTTKHLDFSKANRVVETLHDVIL